VRGSDEEAEVDEGRLHNKVAIVTGGASGFGAETVRRFAEEGARVVIADIDADRGAALVEQLGEEVVFARCDHSRRDDAASTVATATERWGRLDILFNNAAIGWSGGVDDVDDEALERVLEIDLVGPLRMTQAALPSLRASALEAPEIGSVLLFTASGQGLYGTARQSVYVAAKHGVIGWMRSLAQDLGPEGIRVNAICPGISDTPAMRAGTLAVKADPDELLESYRVTTPLRRLITPRDIANAALFLASDEARSIHGLPLVVNAGGKHPY
jgi:3-oxoacyl-[acyl-carrier protein] reductase